MTTHSPRRIFRAEPGALVSTCVLLEEPTRERLRIFSRGRLVGELSLARGDGDRIVGRLIRLATEVPADAPPTVHVLVEGRALCGIDGSPNPDWPERDRWAYLRDAGEATCEVCRDAATRLPKASQKACEGREVCGDEEEDGQ